MAAPATLAGAEARPCTARQCTAGAYAKGKCRCPIGREARRIYVKRNREGRNPAYWVDAVGARRRIQGLLAMGWPGSVIAEAAGLGTQQNVSHIAVERTRVTHATDAAARRAVTALGDRRGPSVHTARRAAKRGYVPLLAWDEDTIDDPGAQPATDEESADVDEIAVARAIHAARADLPPVPLTRAELAIVVPRLAGAPSFFTDTRIERALRISERTAAKLRAAAGVPRATLDQQKAAA